MMTTTMTTKVFNHLNEVNVKRVHTYKRFKDMTDNELCTEFRHISYKMMYCNSIKVYEKMLPAKNAMYRELKARGLENDKRINN